MSKSLLSTFLCLIALVCSHRSSDSDLEMGKYHAVEDAMHEEVDLDPPRTAEPPAPPSEYSLSTRSKIVKSGTIKFEVSNLEIAKSSVDAILHTCKGYYETEQYNSYRNKNTYSLQLRIPNSKFDSLIAVISAGVGELKSKNIAAMDVTEEYVDFSIRLENNLAYLNRYKEILDKAKSIKEILEVQEEI